jgi:hypothetical protein
VGAAITEIRGLAIQRHRIKRNASEYDFAGGVSDTDATAVGMWLVVSGRPPMAQRLGA